MNINVHPVNHRISRRLTPTSVYKLQGMAREMLPEARKHKKGFKDIAHKLANRFKLPESNVLRIVGVRA